MTFKLPNRSGCLLMTVVVMVTTWLLISGQQHFCWWNRFNSVKYRLFYSGGEKKGYGVGKTRQRQTTSSGLSDLKSLCSATHTSSFPCLT